jgi:hypothetical protein
MKPEEFIKRNIGEETMGLFPAKFSKKEIYEYMMDFATEHHQDQVKNNLVLDCVSLFSDEYKDWVKQSDLPPLTNSQYQFASWLLDESNRKIIGQIGDLDKVFSSVRKFLKN